MNLFHSSASIGPSPDEKLLHRNQLSFIRNMLEKSSHGILFLKSTAEQLMNRILGLSQKQ